MPLSVDDRGDFLASFNEQLFTDLLQVPTLYERLHEAGLSSWVAGSHVHTGADRLLLPERNDLLQALADHVLGDIGAMPVTARYVEADEGTMSTVTSELDETTAPPAMLMVYLAGIDLASHHASSPVTSLQRDYLVEHLDPMIERLAEAIEPHGPWYTLVVSDHGHSDVLEGAEHALGKGGTEAPVFSVLTEAGYRVAAPKLGLVDEDADAVVAYQSGAAFIYLARRSPCEGTRCGWERPPRFEADVLPAADAFLRASSSGGELELGVEAVLLRRPRPFDEEDAAFRVYRGQGRSESIAAYCARHGDGCGVDLERRLLNLGTGAHGERAGDLVLLARHGSSADDRYYFAQGYEGTHGSASMQDSRFVLGLSHPDRSASHLERMLQRGVGATAYQHEVAGMLEFLMTRASTPVPPGK